MNIKYVKLAAIFTKVKIPKDYRGLICGQGLNKIKYRRIK